MMQCRHSLFSKETTTKNLVIIKWISSGNNEHTLENPSYKRVTDWVAICKKPMQLFSEVFITLKVIQAVFYSLNHTTVLLELKMCL